jgi:hypothetical protein
MVMNNRKCGFMNMASLSAWGIDIPMVLRFQFNEEENFGIPDGKAMPLSPKNRRSLQSLISIKIMF